jgi:hypothetical protein
MADIIIPQLAPGAPGTFGPGGLYGSTADPRRGSVGPGGILGAFAPLLQAVGPVIPWLAGAAGLASALFPSAAPIIQQVGSFLGQLINPAKPQGAAVGAGTGAAFYPAITQNANPIAVPFDETNLLVSSSFQSPAAMGIDPGYSAAPGAQLPVDYTSLYTATPAALGVGTQMIQVAGQALVRAFPALEAVVPKLLTRLPQAAALASAIYATYQSLRLSGQSHAQAKRQANAAHGVRLRRRRMRPTNVRALRRAMRRVRGFQRTARKVGALHLTRRGFAPAARHRRRRFYRRGDISPWAVEDYEDMSDEAMDLEDDGFDPTGFLGEEAVAE